MVVSNNSNELNSNNNTPNNPTMLTTLDNPFNPFTQFEEWNAFDTSMGYHTCAYLARIAKTSDELSEEVESLAIDNAIDEILELNLTGNYIRVSESTFVDRSKQLVV